MRSNLPDASAWQWARFDRYVLRDGYIRPADDAELQEYHPWREFRQAAARPDHDLSPHRSLLKVLDGVELMMSPGPGGLALSPASEERLLHWCSQYGLLGILLQRVREVVLAARWTSQLAGMATHQKEARLVQPVCPRFVRGTRGWTERSTTLMVTPKAGQIEDGTLLNTDEFFPQEWRLRGWDRPSVTIVDDSGEWNTEPLSTTWARFFPDVPEDERETYWYPTPSDADFWRLYAEPLDVFLHSANTLRSALRALAPAEAQRATSETQDPAAIALAVRTVDSLLSAVHPCPHFGSDGSAQLQWNGGSLLATLAMMAIEDITQGARLVICDNHKCGRLFLADSYQARYCSKPCRYAVQQRAYRQKRRAREQQATRRSKKIRPRRKEGKHRS